MSWLSKIVKKANRFVAKVVPLAKNDPVFQMQAKAWEAGNWDKPFGSEASAWDFLGAGPGAQITSGGKPILGQLDPEDPKDRATGRAIGTAIADWWTFGAFSALAPKPEIPDMQLENGGNGLAFGSLASPGTLSPTQSFAADPSSVTPAQAARALEVETLKRWTWYGVAALALLFILKKGILK